MIIIPDPPRYARKKPIAATTPIPTSPTLVAASFDDTIETLTITFSRPISIAAYDGGQTLANVPTLGSLYAADIHVTLSSDGRTVTAEGEVLESASGTTAWLTVPAGNGIVDAATGAAWAGVTALALPFG